MKFSTPTGHELVNSSQFKAHILERVNYEPYSEFAASIPEGIFYKRCEFHSLIDSFIEANYCTDCPEPPHRWRMMRTYWLRRHDIPENVALWVVPPEPYVGLDGQVIDVSGPPTEPSDCPSTPSDWIWGEEARLKLYDLQTLLPQKVSDWQ